MTPALLTRVTFSSSQTLRIRHTVTTQFDTNTDLTIPAGSYYVSGDGGTDDLLAEIMEQHNASRPSANYLLLVTYDWDSRKIVFNFAGTAFASGGTADVEINRTATSDDIAKAIGFTDTIQSIGTADPNISMQQRPAYVWTAGTEGALAPYTKPSISPVAYQSISIGKVIKTQYAGNTRTMSLGLHGLTDLDTWSGGKSYGEVTNYPYPYNRGLECWYYEAIQAKQFRFYPDFDNRPRNLWGGGTISAGGTLYFETGNTTLFDSKHPKVGVGGSAFIAWPEDEDIYYPAKISTITAPSNLRYTVHRNYYSGSSNYSSITGQWFYTLSRPYWELVLNVNDTGSFNPGVDPSSNLHSFGFSAHVKVQSST